MAIAIISSIMPLTIVETAQDIIGKLPSNMLFWVWIAMLIRIVKPAFDNEPHLVKKQGYARN